MPYICLRRTDIPEGILQVLDLWPNVSQRNPAIDPPGQTKYVSFVPQNDTVDTDAGRITLAVYKGLSAYLLDNIVEGGLAAGTGAMTDANANAAALAIIAGMQAGHAMTEFDLDTYLSAVIANTGFATGGSTGVVTELLSILSGEVYTLPTGSDIEVVPGTKSARYGALANPSRVRRTYNGLALNASCAEGKLSLLKAATFEYLDVAGAALVVYSDTGTVM